LGSRSRIGIEIGIENEDRYWDRGKGLGYRIGISIEDGVDVKYRDRDFYPESPFFIQILDFDLVSYS
jgi:hypothetical protein